MKKCEESFEMIAKWVELNGYMQACGATQKQLLARFDITDKTLQAWLKIPTFYERIKKAKEIFANSTLLEAENALKKLAFGESQQKEIKRIKESDAKGNPVIVQQTEIIKELPPNVGALIFLLCNIAPDKWQQKQVRDITSKGERINFVGFSDEDAKNLAKLKENGLAKE
ncbi:MAG: hypothetical protein IK100_09535 [Muribaculaceae bacterium]|nr:hypothetical protein [Muribaculaceae bacterium]